MKKSSVQSESGGILGQARVVAAMCQAYAVDGQDRRVGIKVGDAQLG